MSTTNGSVLEEASLKLFHVRALLDLLHESVAQHDSTILEQVDAKSWPGLFHSMLQEVDEAKELIDSVPQTAGTGASS